MLGFAMQEAVEATPRRAEEEQLVPPSTLVLEHHHLMCILGSVVYKDEQNIRYTERPAHIQNAAMLIAQARLKPENRRHAFLGRYFVEEDENSRRKLRGTLPRRALFDTWKQSGGVKGSTILTSNRFEPIYRRFRRKYGRVHVAGSKVSLKYQKYTEVDEQGQDSAGPVLYFISHKQVLKAKPTRSAVLQKLRHPLRVLGKPGSGDALVELNSKADNDANFISFNQSGREAGAISTAPAGGVQMTSHSGDFGEWHEQLDFTATLPEGTVVGFYDGKVSTRTAGSPIIGVVSDRPIIVGSKSHDGAKKGVVVAYCGRVPVRTVGPVKSGDVLVPSSQEDGVAVVLPDSEHGILALDCDVDCRPRDRADVADSSGHSTRAVAVAIESSGHTGVGLVNTIVTPPAMTRRVIKSLHGTSGAQRARRLCVGLGALLVVTAAACLLVLLGSWATQIPDKGPRSGALVPTTAPTKSPAGSRAASIHVPGHGDWHFNKTAIMNTDAYKAALEKKRQRKAQIMGNISYLERRQPDQGKHMLR